MAFTDFNSPDEVQKTYQIKLLVAAQKLNQNENASVYGIVTDAEVWQFGKLQGQLFTKNYSRATIDNLNEVFGAVCSIIKLASQN